MLIDFHITKTKFNETKFITFVTTEYPTVIDIVRNIMKCDLKTSVTDNDDNEEIEKSFKK